MFGETVFIPTKSCCCPKVDEFFYGCLRFRGSARAMDVAKIIQDQRLQCGFGEFGVGNCCLRKH